MLSAVVGVARPTDLDAETGTLTIAFPPGSAFNRRKADDKDNKVVVAEAISTVVGTPLRPAFTMLDAEPEVETAPEAGAPSGAARTADPADENELVERFISEFDAEVLVDDPPPQSGHSGPDGPDLPDETEERLEETS